MNPGKVPETRIVADWTLEISALLSPTLKGTTPAEIERFQLSVESNFAIALVLHCYAL